MKTEIKVLVFFANIQISTFLVKKGARGLTWTARNRKKLEQMELLLLTHSPVYRLDLHSPSGKVQKHK